MTEESNFWALAVHTQYKGTLEGGRLRHATQHRDSEEQRVIAGGENCQASPHCQHEQGHEKYRPTAYPETHIQTYIITGRQRMTILLSHCM
jgi:hypothetical protein